VVYTEEVEESRMEVVDVNRVTRRLPADIVCFTIVEAGLYPASGHEHGEGVRMVIASSIGLAPRAVLAKRSTAKFSSPDHKSLVKEAPFLEVGDQGGNRLVTHPGVKFEFVVEVRVLIP
tara:strand:- start:189 stop:545 length:357 start_codon:yes stop_codon:yes gene_type:complete